jgi:hypothetical protein
LQRRVRLPAGRPNGKREPTKLVLLNGPAVAHSSNLLLISDSKTGARPARKGESLLVKTPEPPTLRQQMSAFRRPGTGFQRGGRAKNLRWPSALLCDPGKIGRLVPPGCANCGPGRNCLAPAFELVCASRQGLAKTSYLSRRLPMMRRNPKNQLSVGWDEFVAARASFACRLSVLWLCGFDAGLINCAKA